MFFSYSVSYLFYLSARVTGKLESMQAEFEQEADPGQVAITGLTQRDEQSIILPFTPMGNLA